MLFVKPVGDSPADGVVLDAVLDPASARQILEFPVAQVVGFQYLQLHRHGQVVGWQPVAESDQAFARFPDGSCDKHLQAVQIELSIRVAFARPFLPEFLPFGQRRRDAGADRVGHQRVDGFRGIRVVAHQIA